MTVENREGRYFIAIVYVEVALKNGSRGNIYGAAYQDADEPDARFLYRVRWYVDDKNDDSSQDIKTWRMMRIPRATNNDDMVIDKLRFFADTAAIAGGAEGHVPTLIELRTNDQDAVLRAIAKQPWAHVMFVGPNGERIPMRGRHNENPS